MLYRGLLTVLSLTALATYASAAPLVLEESAKIPHPEPNSGFSFGYEVAMDGAHMLVLGSRFLEGPVPEDPFDDEIEYTTYRFERSSTGQWIYRGRLYTVRLWAYAEPSMAIALEGNVAAIATDEEIAVFERSASGWARVPSTGQGDGTLDVDISGGTIAVGVGRGIYGARLLRKNAQGVWAPFTTLWGPNRTPDGEAYAGYVGISGNTVIVGGYDDTDVPRGEAHIFEGSGSTYARTALLTNPAGTQLFFGNHVAVAGGDALVEGMDQSPGTFLFRREGGVWNPQGVLKPVDAFTRQQSYEVEMRGSLAAVGYPWDDARGSVVVFERNAAGAYPHVATLVQSDGQMGWSSIAVSGRTIAASRLDAIYLYELPADLSPPATLQDDFEDGNANDWSMLAGSNFTVSSQGGTRVLRQSSVTSRAAATLADDRDNQAIQADIRPTYFAGADRWVGLRVRQTDENNYYYVTLRQSHRVDLRKMVDGTFQTLASMPLNMRINRLYRVHLEAVGSRVRAYVNGQLIGDVRDTSLAHGRAGVLMYQSRADIDNVVVSSGPRTPLFADAMDSTMRRWSFSGDGAWDVSAQQTLRQSNLVGGARAISGVSTTDQVVEARARAQQFASGGERWFGLMARYVDDGNYYYVTVRNHNQISLRKLVNGAITVLDSAAMTVTPGTWYTLRIEAVANAVRAYVNGVLVLEATDPNPIPAGRYGAVLYKTVAEFDDFSVYQP